MRFCDLGLPGIPILIENWPRKVLSLISMNKMLGVVLMRFCDLGFGLPNPGLRFESHAILRFGVVPGAQSS